MHTGPMDVRFWLGHQFMWLRFWVAHHVAVPLLRRALRCPTRRADYLEDRLRREMTIGRVARVVEQMQGESDQDLEIYADHTVARILRSLESMEAS